MTVAKTRRRRKEAQQQAMHYSILVILPKDVRPKTVEEVQTAVGGALGRWRDSDRFDWYQVGGRWTGALSEYKPEEDPSNADPSRSGGAKWPTSWAPFEGDCQPTSRVTPEMADRFYGYVLPDPPVWRDWEEWDGRTFVRVPSWDICAALRDHPGHFAVVVDVHR